MNSDLQRLAERLLNQGAASLPERDQRVLNRIAKRAQISRNLEQEFSAKLTFGDRRADRVAEIGGSWSFIIGFGAFLGAWAIVNSIILAKNAFDPYPYIFLNLLLSMIAAVQAPIIMMSQNRQAEKDRLAVAHDYEVNLKAEIEIMALHDKLDALGMEHTQWSHRGATGATAVVDALARSAAIRLKVSMSGGPGPTLRTG